MFSGSTLRSKKVCLITLLFMCYCIDAFIFSFRVTNRYNDNGYGHFKLPRIKQDSRSNEIKSKSFSDVSTKSRTVLLVVEVGKTIGTEHDTATTSDDNSDAGADSYLSSLQEKSPTKAWLKKYDELKEFRNVHGHCNVLRTNKSLGNWVVKQRGAYKVAYAERNNLVKSDHKTRRGVDKDELSASTMIDVKERTKASLTSFQIRLLNDIDFIWDVNEWRYQLNLDKLESFFHEHGHVNIPTSSDDEEHKSLYNWSRRQRDEYRKYLHGKESTLSSRRRQELEKRGFHIGMFDAFGQKDEKTNGGIVRSFNRTSWEGRYQELVQFVEDNGHCNVPSTDKQYSQLSGWVNHQRSEKKKKGKGIKSRLSDEKEKLLDALGFIWSLQEHTWQQRLNQLRLFKEKYGHVRVHTKDGQLGNWVMIQRLQYGLYKKGEKNTLSHERIEALNELGFDWDMHEVSWEEKFNEVKECLNNCSNPNDEDGKIYPQHLLSWISGQRSEKRYKLQGLHSHLTHEREMRLTEIGFDWKIEQNRKKLRQEHWVKNFEKLSAYKLKHDTCRVPVSKKQTQEERGFSHWVRDQRRYYKAYLQNLPAPITVDRVSLLDSIGFADDIVI